MATTTHISEVFCMMACGVQPRLEMTRMYVGVLPVVYTMADLVCGAENGPLPSVPRNCWVLPEMLRWTLALENPF